MIVERLIQFYNRYKGGYEAGMSDIWLAAITSHKPLIAELNAQCPEGVQRTLDTIGPSGGLCGLEDNRAFALDEPFCFGYFQKLAQYAGAVSLFHPGQLSPTKNWKVRQVEEVKASIEQRLGFKLSVPACFGFDCSKGVPIRFVLYHYPAALAILGRIGKPPMNILEIGAGLGQMGLIAWQWKAISYSVIDLPHIAVLSAYFMSKVCGESNVWLAGEPEENAWANFYPSTNFQDVAEYEYDLILNIDSLPEMPTVTQDCYIDLISNCLHKWGGLFLSINHESDRGGQSHVPSAVRRNGKLKLVSRTLFPILEGYAEEFYSL